MALSVSWKAAWLECSENGAPPSSDLYRREPREHAVAAERASQLVNTEIEGAEALVGIRVEASTRLPAPIDELELSAYLATGNPGGVRCGTSCIQRGRECVGWLRHWRRGDAWQPATRPAAA